MLSDNDFIKQLENCTLPADQFDHVGHLRIAWLYLRELEIKDAITKTANSIQNYASSLGAPKKFHYTLTVVSLFILKERMMSDPAGKFETFLENQPDLRSHFKDLVHAHYSQERLSDSRAQESYIEPDLKDFFEPFSGPDDPLS
ncbi:MAG: hypothetical protein ABJN40_20355 [Sneathiella sp.]